MPAVVGSGTATFAALSKHIDLATLEVHKFTSGAVLLRYRAQPASALLAGASSGRRSLRWPAELVRCSSATRWVDPRSSVKCARSRKVLRSGDLLEVKKLLGPLHDAEVRHTLGRSEFRALVTIFHAPKVFEDAFALSQQEGHLHQVHLIH